MVGEAAIDPHAMGFLVCESAQRREVLELHDLFTSNSASIVRSRTKLFEVNPKAEPPISVIVVLLRSARRCRAAPSA